MTRAFLSLSLMASLSLVACSDDGKKSSSGGSGGSSSQGGSGGGGAGGAGGSGGTAGRGGAGGSGGGGSGGMAGTGGSGGTAGSGGTGGSSVDAAAGGAGGTRDAGTGGASGDVRPPSDSGPAATTMTFFVTSKGSGKGGDFGGLDGADAHCKALAMAVSPALGAKNWKAYLSTSTVNAITRIGNGPWFNARGVMVARNVMELHEGQGMNGALNATWPIGAAAFDVILDEKGAKHENAVHDILTGSTMGGMVDGSNHCSNWTSQMGNAANGHSNRDGGMRAPSWNFAHTVGCGSELTAGGMLQNRVTGTVTSGGGRGSIYCFVP